MPDEFRTSFELLREVVLNQSLKGSITIDIYTVPKLRFSMMKIVYAIKIQVFLVPSEHSFPRSNINIRSIYSLNFVST
jgi:hypothetical protein